MRLSYNHSSNNSYQSQIIIILIVIVTAVVIDWDECSAWLTTLEGIQLNSNSNRVLDIRLEQNGENRYRLTKCY